MLGNRRGAVLARAEIGTQEATASRCGFLDATLTTQGDIQMKVLIIYAHPNPESFNGAVLESFTGGLEEAGHTFETVDLYAIGFALINNDGFKPG